MRAPEELCSRWRDLSRVPELIPRLESVTPIDETRSREAHRLAAHPDACIDAVGTEARGTSFDALYDRAKVAVGLGTDWPHVLRQAVQACRKGGVVSIPGVYGGFIDGLGRPRSRARRRPRGGGRAWASKTVIGP
jgi:threonine dehydrogenase-like Zn-dependent dehydrogenase